MRAIEHARAAQAIVPADVIEELARELGGGEGARRITVVGAMPAVDTPLNGPLPSYISATSDSNFSFTAFSL